MPSVSLAEVFSRLGLDQVDLMKMDCEGAEYPVLFNASDEVLGRIQRMVMEYHDNVTEFTHVDLERFLSIHGFQVQSFVNPVHDYLGYLYAWRKLTSMVKKFFRIFRDLCSDQSFLTLIMSNDGRAKRPRLSKI